MINTAGARNITHGKGSHILKSATVKIRQERMEAQPNVVLRSSTNGLLLVSSVTTSAKSARAFELSGNICAREEDGTGRDLNNKTNGVRMS